MGLLVWLPFHMLMSSQKSLEENIQKELTSPLRQILRILYVLSYGICVVIFYLVLLRFGGIWPKPIPNSLINGFLDSSGCVPFVFSIQPLFLLYRFWPIWIRHVSIIASLEFLMTYACLIDQDIRPILTSLVPGFSVFVCRGVRCVTGNHFWAFQFLPTHHHALVDQGSFHLLLHLLTVVLITFFSVYGSFDAL